MGGWAQGPPLQHVPAGRTRAPGLIRRTLRYRVVFAGTRVGDFLHDPGRPADGDLLDGGGAEAEVDAGVAGGEVALARLDLADLAPRFGLDRDPRPDPLPVGLRAPQDETDPVAVRPVVSEQLQRLPRVRDRDVKVPVVVVVGNGGAPADQLARERRAAPLLVELPLPVVPHQERALRRGRALESRMLQDVAVGDESVEASGVGGVEKVQPEAGERKGRAAEPG